MLHTNQNGTYENFPITKLQLGKTLDYNKLSLKVTRTIRLVNCCFDIRTIVRAIVITNLEVVFLGYILSQYAMIRTDVVRLHENLMQQYRKHKPDQSVLKVIIKVYSFV